MHLLSSSPSASLEAFPIEPSGNPQSLLYYMTTPLVLDGSVDAKWTLVAGLDAFAVADIGTEREATELLECLIF